MQLLVALYGYKGTNGAILITTKRGKYNSQEVKFTYDHVWNFMANKPKFVDASTYAQAVNEARSNDGLALNILMQKLLHSKMALIQQCIQM